jgi:general secretion pathway protein K
VVLPRDNKVNVNTAPAEVLAALVPNYSVAEANSLVASRRDGGWRTTADFAAQLGGRTPIENTYDVKSEWFLVYSRIRLDRAALDAEALVHRPLTGLDLFGGTTVEWIRQI